MIGDFQDRLESLIKRALVGAVTGNRWWVSLKHMIRDFSTKYGPTAQFKWGQEGEIYRRFKTPGGGKGEGAA